MNAQALALIGRIRNDLADLEALLAAEAPPAAPTPPGPPPPVVTPPGTLGHGLGSPVAFFNALRVGVLGPTLSQEEVDGCTRTLNAAAARRWPVAWAAYGLATKYHETAGTMRPIREYGRGKGKPYGVPGRNGGQVPYGRGDVQLTHDVNYERADKELGLKGALIANYDLALDPDIAARIMVRGMEEGWFTGKGLATYLPPVADIHQFSNCRRVVNGLDDAVLIAGYALEFQADLQAGAWA